MAKGVITVQFQPAVNLRLNDIIDPDNPFVEFGGFEELTDFDNNPDLQKYMYNLVVESYRWAYLNADNKEQFVAWFTTYWNRHIPKYLPLLLQQIKVSQDLYKARIEEHDFDKTNTETPDLQTVTDYKLGDKVSLQHGRVMTHERDLAENGDTTEYEVQVTDGNRKLTGTESNSYSGTDVTSREGTNTDTRKQTGTNTIKVKDKGKNTVTIYDAEKFRVALNTNSVMDKFIDEFEPLFVSILYIL